MGSELILKPAGFKTWELVKPFKVETSKGIIEVPKGTVTDLASVPRVLWNLVPPFGRYTQAAVVHDFLYGTKMFTRKECDQIFYELMIQYGTWKWKAKIMYGAVRCFGWVVY